MSESLRVEDVVFSGWPKPCSVTGFSNAQPDDLIPFAKENVADPDQEKVIELARYRQLRRAKPPEKLESQVGDEGVEPTIGEAYRYPPSPFSGLDEEKEYKGKIEKIISFFSYELNPKIGGRIGRRIKALCEPEEEGEVLPDINSLGKLFQFFSENFQIKCPELSVTPKGNVFAQWWESTEKLLSLEFFPNGEIHLVLFSPGSGTSGAAVRIFGKDYVGTILGNLAGYSITTWILDGPENTD